MKWIAPVFMFIILMLPLFALEEDRLRTNLITNVAKSDVLDQDGNSRVTSVVVGYDAAATDYLSANKISVFLTSMNREMLEITLSCTEGPQLQTVFVPAQREVLVRTNLDPQTSHRILMGGPVINELVGAYPEVERLLKEPGDILIQKYGNDIVVAGYTGLDTERAVTYLLELLRS